MVQDIFNKLITYSIYSYLILIPLVYFKGSKSVFSMPKLFCFYIITAILIGLLIFKIIQEYRLKLLKTKFTKILIIYALIVIVSAIFSSQIYASIYGIQGRFIGIIAYLSFLLVAFLVMQFFPKDKIKTLIKISVIVATIIAIWGILQHRGLLETNGWSTDPKERAFATLEHGNHFGAYLVFNLMLLFSLILETKNKLLKITWIVFIPFFLTAILYTASRGAILSLIASTLVFGLLLLNQKNNFSKKHIKKILISCFAIFILISFLLIILFSKLQTPNSKLPNVINRTIETINFVKAGNVPDRISWALSSFAMFIDKPILGHGFSAFQDSYNQYRRKNFRNVDDTQYEITPESAHNEFLTKLSEEGILGFLSYLILLGYIAKCIWIKLKTKDKENIWLIGISSALFSYIVQVMLSFGVVTTYTLFFIFIGVAMKLTLTEKDEKNVRKIHESFLGKTLITIGGLIIIVLIINTGYKQLMAEVNYRRMETSMKTNNIEAGMYFGDQMVTYMPYEQAYFSKLGDYLYQLAMNEEGEKIDYLNIYFQNAINSYGKAVSISSILPHLHANLGLLYYSYGEFLKSIKNTNDTEKYFSSFNEEYQKAVKYGVNNPLFSYNYAYLLKNSGKYLEAIEQYKNVLTIRNPYKDAENNLNELLLKIEQEN